ncbi:MAG: L,D-transpeptidase family protein [Candidatus Binataceae bacterium]|jgi:lipoprotein-anchoring transpeptidase ErfK/SrfK
MGKHFRLAIVLLTIVLAAAPIGAAAQTAAPQPTAAVMLPAVQATPIALPVPAGTPTAQAVGTVAVAPAISSPALPPAPARSLAIAQPAAKRGPSRAPLATQTPAIDHVFYGRPAHAAPATPVAAATPAAAATAAATPPPTGAPTAVAALIPPSPATAPGVGLPTPVVSAAPATPARPSDEGLRLYLSDPVSATSSSFNWTVAAYKSRHRIEVFYKRHLYKSYHAVFGRSRFAGAKQWEGDRRTPEGNYLMVSKHPSRRFRWFLKINYPNAVDQANFVHAKADGDIPRGMREGDGVGIHGSDLPILNLGDIDWTTGCISVDNADISELARLLPIGTLVTIKP